MIDNKTIKRLTKERATHCLSLYLPTHRANGMEKDKIQFKNLLSDARAELQANGLDTHELDTFLAPATGLLDDVAFWQNLSDGLVIFLKKDKMEHFIVPVSVKPFVYAGKHFYLRPLLPMTNGRNRFFLLALSQNEVRFFEGDKHSITPVKIDDIVVENKEEALSITDDDQTDALQMHASGTIIYHGQGSNKDRSEEEIRKFLRYVDDGLMEMLYDEQAPMIIAAVDYLVPMYKDISRYSNLVDAHISGNPEQDDPVLLHEKAWAQLQQLFNETRDKYKEEFGNYLAEDKASFSLDHVVPAAAEGKVEALFITKGKRHWGKYIPDERRVKHQSDRSAESRDLLEYAALQTYLNGGKVYEVERNEMAQPVANINAVYRY